MTHDGPLIHADAATRDPWVDAVRAALDAEPDVVFAYVHGSILTPLPFRDLDVAVYLDIQAPRQLRMRTLALGATLDAVVSAVPRSEPAPPVDLLAPPVDVLALNLAPLGFRYQVLKRGRLLVCRDEARRTRWAVRTWSRYLDLKPLRDRALKEAMTA